MTKEQRLKWRKDIATYGDNAYSLWEFRSNFTQPIAQFENNDDVPTGYANSMIIYRKKLAANARPNAKLTSPPLTGILTAQMR